MIVLEKGRRLYIYVKNSLNFFERKDLIRDNLEAVFIEIHESSSASFIVGTIYRPPSASVDSFAAIEKLVELIDDENKEFYLHDDLNANMLDSLQHFTYHKEFTFNNGTISNNSNN